jgi:hypothetical protein
MSVESAEMTKHAVNTFLATSVTFINEIAALCEETGADAGEVARGLKSESRIGPRAYLGPGAAFAGGTLARDVMFLSELGRTHGRATGLIDAVKTSNDAHRAWAQQRLADLLGRIDGANVGIWGLTYKPGTDTLRRSSAIELCQWLAGHGAHVKAHDPAVKILPPGLEASIDLLYSALDAVRGASALVVCTAWPEYRNVSVPEVIARMTRGAGAGHPGRWPGPRRRGRGIHQRWAGVRSRPLAGRAAIIASQPGLGLRDLGRLPDAGASVLMCARGSRAAGCPRRDLGPRRIRSTGGGARRGRVPARGRRTAGGRCAQLFPQVHALVNNAGIYLREE